MSSLASWIDPDEVASIARSLCSPEQDVFGAAPPAEGRRPTQARQQQEPPQNPQPQPARSNGRSGTATQGPREPG